MTLDGSPSRTGSTATYVGSVWVVARHRLVAQALAAALGRRVADVRVLLWDPEALREADVDADEDVLLIVDDVRSPAALAATRALLAQVPSRSLLMTELDRGYAWGGLLDAGVTDIIAEPESVERLAEVIEEVRAGSPVIPEDERSRLIEAWERHLAEEEELAERMATLSPRERMVLDSLASGRRPGDISVSWGVAESTVRTHIRSIRRKLAVDSQLRAVLVAHRLSARAARASPGLPSPRRSQE